MRVASFEAIVRALNDAGVRYLIAGGMVPITASEFADARTRSRWIVEKGMTVLGFNSDRHRDAPVDVFVDVPFDFASEYERALRGEIKTGLVAPFVSLDTLIAMKAAAGRPRDQDDIEHLNWIREDQASND